MQLHYQIAPSVENTGEEGGSRGDERCPNNNEYVLVCNITQAKRSANTMPAAAAAVLLVLPLEQKLADFI